eukprot:c27384_g1_i1.p1 GENE.c27384_g1_i1~~c27384_g1_i1.p1  ORF type:complete len:215 (+),score=-14.79 c27384_g1_i1:36-680(+)
MEIKLIRVFFFTCLLATGTFADFSTTLVVLDYQIRTMEEEENPVVLGLIAQAGRAAIPALRTATTVVVTTIGVKVYEQVTTDVAKEIATASGSVISGIFKSKPSPPSDNSGWWVLGVVACVVIAVGAYYVYSTSKYPNFKCAKVNFIYAQQDCSGDDGCDLQLSFDPPKKCGSNMKRILKGGDYEGVFICTDDDEGLCLGKLASGDCQLLVPPS